MTPTEREQLLAAAEKVEQYARRAIDNGVSPGATAFMSDVIRLAAFARAQLADEVPHVCSECGATMVLSRLIDDIKLADATAWDDDLVRQVRERLANMPGNVVEAGEARVAYCGTCLAAIADTAEARKAVRASA